jgi:hypothetical protein
MVHELIKRAPHNAGVSGLMLSIVRRLWQEGGGSFNPGSLCS